MIIWVTALNAAANCKKAKPHVIIVDTILPQNNMEMMIVNQKL
ncbi:hypothetical protein [Clostridium tyrobutyricum]|nr:hypothetical protein [Clostridium tyrobutyricum]